MSPSVSLHSRDPTFVAGSCSEMRGRSHAFFTDILSALPASWRLQMPVLPAFTSSPLQVVFPAKLRQTTDDHVLEVFRPIRMRSNDDLARISSQTKKWSLSAEMHVCLGGFGEVVCQCKNPSRLLLFQPWPEDTWMVMLRIPQLLRLPRYFCYLSMMR